MKQLYFRSSRGWFHFVVIMGYPPANTRFDCFQSQISAALYFVSGFVYIFEMLILRPDDGFVGSGNG